MPLPFWVASLPSAIAFEPIGSLRFACSPSAIESASIGSEAPPGVFWSAMPSIATVCEASRASW
jgi:hypothetical protein